MASSTGTSGAVKIAAIVMSLFSAKAAANAAATASLLVCRGVNLASPAVCHTCQHVLIDDALPCQQHTISWQHACDNSYDVTRHQHRGGQ